MMALIAFSGIKSEQFATRLVNQEMGSARFEQHLHSDVSTRSTMCSTTAKLSPKCSLIFNLEEVEGYPHTPDTPTHEHTTKNV